MPLPPLTTHAPVYLMRLPSGDAMATNRDSMDAFEGLLGKGFRFAFLIDATHAETPDGRTRRFIADRVRSREPEFRRDCAGLGIIYSSLFQTAVASTIGVFLDPPFPVEHFSDEKKAIAWATSLFSDKTVDN